MVLKSLPYKDFYIARCSVSNTSGVDIMDECSLEDAIKVDYFENLWKEQGRTLTIKQKDEIGIAYLKHIIGADDATINAFLDEDNLKEHNNATYVIGMMMAGVNPCKHDIKSFWQAMDKIGVEYSKEDLEFLLEKDGGSGALTMTFNISLAGRSHVQYLIDITAHAYK